MDSIRTCILLTLLLALTACGADEPPRSASKVVLFATDYGEQWPLTISEAQVECLHGSAVVATDRATGQRYAVNGTALSQLERLNASRIDAIWKDDPELPGLKINIGPLIEAGLRLCG